LKLGNGFGNEELLIFGKFLVVCGEVNIKLGFVLGLGGLF